MASCVINSDGILAVIWIDEDSEQESLRDLFFAFSANGGLTFSKPLKVSNKSSIPNSPLNRDVANKFYSGGHYIGIAAKSDNSFQLAWCASQNEVFRLYSCNVKI